MTDTVRYRDYERVRVTERSHISIFTTSLRTGGAERVAVNISAGLVEQGFEVDLVLVDAHGRLLAEVHPDVTIVDLSSDRVLTSIPKLISYLSNDRPDVLYSMMPHNNMAAYLAHVVSRSTACFVPSEHNIPTSDITSVKDRLLLKGSCLVHSHADHSIAVSNGVRDELSRLTGVPHDDMSVVYNPIVTDELKASAVEESTHPWFSEAVTLMSTGRHVEQKGFDTLIEAFALVRERTTKDVRLLIFGEGPQTEAYRKLAEELGVDSFVEFPGFVDNIFAQMAAADIFVLSSRWEGFGNVVVEAMACGTQVVATDCRSGPAEILSDGTYGTLVEVEDSESLAEGILMQLEHSNAYPVTERAAEFTASAIAEQYAQIFERYCPK